MKTQADPGDKADIESGGLRNGEGTLNRRSDGGSARITTRGGSKGLHVGKGTLRAGRRE